MKMKRLLVATSVALLLFAPLTFSTSRPLNSSGAWLDYDTVGANEQQTYFAKNF